VSGAPGAYADVVTEARDGHGSCFPLADRANLLRDADPHRALDERREGVVRHTPERPGRRTTTP
jgi:hypothetical protein